MIIIHNFYAFTHTLYIYIYIYTLHNKARLVEKIWHRSSLVSSKPSRLPLWKRVPQVSLFWPTSIPRISQYQATCDGRSSLGKIKPNVGVWGGEGTTPGILIFEPRRLWAISFTLWPLYFRRKRSPAPIGKPMAPFGCNGGNKILEPIPVERTLVDWRVP
jgi:hypothetical protein